MRNSRRGDVNPFIVMDVMESARKAEQSGRDVIHMEVGQPATGAPKAAISQLSQKMQNAPLGYTVSLGLPELRQRIAKLYQEWYNVDLSAERVVITAGSSAAFLLSFISLFDTGENIAIGDPGYPSYRNILKALGLNPMRIETGPDTRFQPVAKHLAALDIQGLLVASPANPTGTMLGRDAMTDIIQACADKNISFISDEIYHRIDYGKPAVSALEISDDVYVINSFSKYFSMTGWRIGWMVVPQSHVRRIERLSQNLFICAPHASQIAALHAMDCHDELQQNRQVYAKNREILINGLPKAGFGNFAPPDGAFYIYADVSNRTSNSQELAAQILAEAGVAVTPGLDFDPVRGHKTLRFSYAGSTKDMIEAIDRLIKWHKKAGH